MKDRIAEAERYATQQRKLALASSFMMIAAGFALVVAAILMVA